MPPLFTLSLPPRSLPCHPSSSLDACQILTAGAVDVSDMLANPKVVVMAAPMTHMLVMHIHVATHSYIHSGTHKNKYDVYTPTHSFVYSDICTYTHS